MAENSFMTTMISFQNDWTIFFRRPVSGIMMIVSIIALFLPTMRKYRALRRVERAA
jgi:putative tricarboxylic transport membrane protein